MLLRRLERRPTAVFGHLYYARDVLRPPERRLEACASHSPACEPLLHLCKNLRPRRTLRLITSMSNLTRPIRDFPSGEKTFPCDRRTFPLAIKGFASGLRGCASSAIHFTPVEVALDATARLFPQSVAVKPWRRRTVTA
jgi:hypothetical protein